LQREKPELQLDPQTPLLQLALAFGSLVEHMFPQPPQLLGSICSLSHKPWQRTNPALHMSTHCPVLQLAVPFGSLVEQTFAQAPQFFESVCSLTQPVPQRE
jgi:hypothetical protein